MSEKSEFARLRKATGLTQKAFSKRYEIPLRTIEHWESGDRTPPDYLLNFLREKIENESSASLPKEICYEALIWNCQKLQIEIPKLKFAAAAAFPAPTVRAALSEDFNEIAINTSVNWSALDIWFAVSHESRHMWQHLNGIFNSSEYVPSDGKNLKTYNEQKEEIDANAWAVLVVSSLFGVRPTLENNLGSEVWEKTQKRINEIKNTIS